MKRWLIVIFILLGIQFSESLYAQGDAIRPQIWNNLFVGWDLTDHFTLRGEVSYNVLLSQEAPWNEITTAVSGVYRFHPFMEGIGGIYIAAAQQSKELRSYEYRPYLGFRVSTNNSKRWLVTNLTRFEVRAFRYNTGARDLAARFRNRTYGIVSLNQQSILNDRNIFLFGYFEAFINLGEDVKERFVNQFKYKLGFAYRHNFSWRMNIGMIYQDSRDNIEQPTNLPYTIVTNWVLDWTLVYIIPVPKKD